jgi:mRNA interferase MazF
MKKGEIWLVELPSTDGHEQSGNRPVIVLSDTESNISIIIPFTSNLQALRFLHTLEIKPSKNNGLKDISVALLFHIRAIDKKRLKKKLGDLDNSDLKEIDKILKKLLKI